MSVVMTNNLSIKAVFYILGSLLFSFSCNAATKQDIERYVDSSQSKWQALIKQTDEIINKAPNKKISSMWQELDKLVMDGKDKLALEKATDPVNDMELQVYLVWLRAKMLHKADSRYAYSYAANLRLLKDDSGEYPFEMAVYAYYANLAFKVDAEQCEDGSDVEQFITGYETQKAFLDVLSKVNTLTNKQKVGAMVEALALNKVLSDRVGNDFICRIGQKSYELAQKGDFGKLLKKLPNEQSPDYIGGKDNTYQLNIPAAKLVGITKSEAEKKVIDSYMDEILAKIASGD